MPQRWISGRLIRRWAAWMEGIMTVVRERSRQQRFERSASIWPLIGSAGLAVLIVLDALRLASRFDQLSVRFVATYAFLLLAQAILLVIIIRKHIRALRALAKQPPSLDSESAPGDIIWHGDDDSAYIVHDKVEYVVAVHPRFVPMLDVRGAAIPTRTPADVSTYGAEGLIPALLRAPWLVTVSRRDTSRHPPFVWRTVLREQFSSYDQARARYLAIVEGWDSAEYAARSPVEQDRHPWVGMLIPPLAAVTVFVLFILGLHFLFGYP